LPASQRFEGVDTAEAAATMQEAGKRVSVERYEVCSTSAPAAKS
jgi:hypothetical protein